MIQTLRLLLFFCFAFSTLKAQLNPQALSIPMRDGKSLSGDVYLPNQTDSFPVILIQTPYNKGIYPLTGLPLGLGNSVSGLEYAIVVVDWRCFYASASACTTSVKRGEDGYDTVEWIAQQSWCNGKIGTYGPSALGNVQFETAYEQPPNLVCAVPEVPSPQPGFQQYYPGGALRLEYVQTLGGLFGSAGMALVAANPYYNLLWQFSESAFHPQDVAIPMFMVGGWYDHNTREDFWVMDTLRQVSNINVRDKHKFLVGPWVHGGTGLAKVGTDIQGELSYPLAEFWNDSLAWDFFDFYMRGIPNGWESRPRYQYYQMGDDSWENSMDWPPPGLVSKSLYLLADNSMSDTISASASNSLSFNYDPADPSPTVGGKTLNLALDQGPYDQRNSVESRGDALIFTSSTLTSDMEVTGTIKAHLQFSSDRKDTDLILRLTDVYPDGRSMLMGESVMRLRYRNGFSTSDTAMMTAGTVYPVTLDFHPLALTFLAGHKVRLIVTSSQYPRYNRNMNNGAEVHPNGNIDTLANPLIANNTLHLSSTYPSYLEFPVLNPATGASESDGFLDDLGLGFGPNPNNGRLEIRNLAAPCVLELMNMDGELLLRQPEAGTEADLSLDGLPNGIYFLKVTEVKSGRAQVKKVILGR